jgi:hypothetical protein
MPLGSSPRRVTLPHDWAFQKTATCTGRIGTVPGDWSANRKLAGSPIKEKSSHYGVTGSMRESWIRLKLFEESQSRATSGGNRS